MQDNSKIPFSGLGLVFGTAIGAGLCVVLTVPIYWSGVGTAIGLIIGAAIDSSKKKTKK